MLDYDTVYTAVSQIVPAKYVMVVTFGILFAMQICAFIASRLSRPAEGSWKMPIYKLINLIAFNVAKATNADDAQANKGKEK